MRRRANAKVHDLVKVCYVANSMVPSRTANSVHVMKMCQAYGQLGHDVTLVLPDRPNLTEPGVNDVHQFYDVDPCFEIRKLKPRRPTKAWLAMAVPYWVNKHIKPDLVHTRVEWAGLGLSRIFGIQCVLELHESPFTSQLRRAAIRSFAASAKTSLVAITQALATHLREHLPPETEISIEPDGVDRAWLAKSATKEWARQTIGLDDIDGPIAAYVGSLYEGRGIETIVELADRLPEVTFVVVGGRETQVQAWRAKSSGSPNLRFIGFVQQSEVFHYLSSADVLLMPHGDKVLSSGRQDIASYCSPMKMFEYMAAGRPIVASSLPVLQEVLQDGQNAILVSSGDIQAWREALARVLSKNGSAEQLSERARSDVAKFTWHARAKRIVESHDCVAL